MRAVGVVTVITHQVFVLVRDMVEQQAQPFQRRQRAKRAGRHEYAVGDQGMYMRIEGDQVAEGLYVEIR